MTNQCLDCKKFNQIIYTHISNNEALYNTFCEEEKFNLNAEKKDKECPYFEDKKIVTNRDKQK